MEVGLWSLALGRVEQLGLRPLHVAVAGDGVALPVLRFLLLAVITPSAFVDQLANDGYLKVAFDFSVLLARVGAFCLRRELRSIDVLLVAELVVVGGADALVRLHAGVLGLRGAVPVRDALVALGALPAGLAQARVGLHARSHAALRANRLVAERTRPTLFALAGVRLQVVGVGDLGALSVLAAALQLLALHAVVSGPAIIASASMRLVAPPMFGIARLRRTGRLVAECALPHGPGAVLVHVAVALEGVGAAPVLAAGQRHAVVAQVTLPSDLARADVRADALAVDAGLDAPLVQVLADGHRARVLEVPLVLVFRLSVAIQADHVRVVVADVPVCLLEVFGDAGVVVILQWCEEAGPHDVGLGQAR